MKHSGVYLIIILAIVVLAFFTKSKHEFVREDLIGTWENTAKVVDEDQIIAFTIYQDSTAVLKIQANDGVKSRKGTWVNNAELKFLNKKISLKGDLKMKYWPDENKLRIVFLKVQSGRKNLSLRLAGSTFKKKRETDTNKQ